MPTNNTNDLSSTNFFDINNTFSQNGTTNGYVNLFSSPFNTNNNANNYIYTGIVPDKDNSFFENSMLTSSFTNPQNQNQTFVNPFTLYGINNTTNTSTTNFSTSIPNSYATQGISSVAQTAASTGAKIASDTVTNSNVASATARAAETGASVATSAANNSTSSTSTSTSSTSSTGTANNSAGTTTTTSNQDTVSNEDVFDRMMSNRQTANAGMNIENTQETNTPQGGENTSNTDGITYTVKEGDNLSSILKEQTGDGSYENYMRVARENGIDDPNKIQAGQTITINPNTSDGANQSVGNTANASSGNSSTSSTPTSGGSSVSSTDSSSTPSSGGSSDIKQIQFLNSDLYTEVKADAHEEFMYDCEQDTSLNAVKDVIEKVEELKTATSTLEQALDALASGVYANKTEVKSKFDDTISQMQNRNTQITSCITEWCEGIKAFYEDQVNSNQELLNDLQTINDYLDDGSFSDWNM